MHTVSVLAFDSMAPFELGAVVEVFGVNRLGQDWYDLRVCAETTGALRMAGGFTMTAEHDLETFANADTVIVPGASVYGDESPAVIEALRRAHERGARIVSICSGAFALAAAGLLDGKAATTHWKYAPILARRYPQIDVRPDVLYVDNGNVLTSAGSAAGIDLCLHLVRTDHGAGVANSIARHLVAPPHRDGGQAQYVEATVMRHGEDDPIGRATGWALDNLTAGITVRELARQAHLSQRTFIRHFTKRTGTSPLRWVITQRVLASLPLLESTSTPVEKVGAAVGFDSPATFRHHFGRTMNVSPAAYRRTFTHRPSA
jgi:AraC family transcriptional activator FtrA